MIKTKKAGKCPYCGSDLIDYETMCPDGKTVRCDRICTKCNKEWLKATISRNESYRDVFNRVLPVGCIIDYHIQNNVFYGVVEGVRGDTSQTQRYMEIVPFTVQGNSITYYPIPETWNPEYYDAPKRLLGLLTPLYPNVPSWCKRKEVWRDECRRRNNYIAEEIRQTLEGMPCPMDTRNYSDSMMLKINKELEDEMQAVFGTTYDMEDDKVSQFWWETLERIARNHSIPYYEDED